jgi:hypothetical protein
VIASPPVRLARAAGFSLFEVVIAAGLLLLTVASVSAAAASISHGGRRAEAAMRADGVVDSVLVRLAGLPFCAAALPEASAVDPSAAPDLLAAVFPDAGALRDTADARYVGTDEGGIPGGSFVTRYEQDGVPVTCVARFRRQVAGTWLEPADLAGWDVAVSGRPPAPVVVVEVSVSGGGAVRTGRLVREAGADAVPRPLPAPSVGS